MSSTRSEDSKSSVQDFWERNPCGYPVDIMRSGDEVFFAEIEQRWKQIVRYWPDAVQFDELSRNKTVLEIGCGLGNDAVQFSSHGAKYVGVDLTPVAAQSSRLHLATRNLKGDTMVADGEKLPFRDQAFDVVYSAGVLHHTPDTDRAIQDAIRVLKPGGELVLMLYHRHSYHYYVRVMFTMRLLVLMLYPDFMLSLARRLSGKKLRQFAFHRERLREMGLGYLRPSTLINHNTDGAECPIAKVYSKREVKQLLNGLDDIRFRTCNSALPPRLRFLEKWVAPIGGFFLWAYARKPEGAIDATQHREVPMRTLS